MKTPLLSVCTGIVLFFASTLFANNSALRSDHPDDYVVKKGDTLWDISETFLKSPWLWPEIWHANQHIKNPHLIFPGDVVRLVYIDGKPRLTVDRTDRLQPGKLKPSIRSRPLEDAVPTVPLERINSFLSRNRIFDEGLLEAAPYVISGQEERLITGAGDRLYAKGFFADDIANYTLYRKGQDYIDPDTGELLGVQGVNMGNGAMRAYENAIATLSILKTTGEIRAGDRLFPSQEKLFDSTFFPSDPEMVIEGKIMTVERGVTQVGMLDVVAINRGEQDALKPGNVLAIYKKGPTIKDDLAKDRKEKLVKLPDERAGLLMIFQTFEKMSLAIVMKADRGIAIGDAVRNP